MGKSLLRGQRQPSRSSILETNVVAKGRHMRHSSCASPCTSAYIHLDIRKTIILHNPTFLTISLCALARCAIIRTKVRLLKEVVYGEWQLRQEIRKALCDPALARCACTRYT